MNIGKFTSESLAEENLVARQIVNEITKFGVNDRQILLIINTLALNLENVEHMKSITSVVDKLKDSNMSIIDKIDGKIGYISGKEADNFSGE